MEQSFDAISQDVRVTIVTSLELDIEPEAIGVDQPLFESAANGGLELDSLGALEILFAVGAKYRLIDLSEVEPQQVHTVRAITELVRDLLGRQEP